jgi:hypothetical protein
MRARKVGDEIELTESFLFRDSIKEIAGRRYDADQKAWFIPQTQANTALVKMLGAELSSDLKATVAEVKPQGEVAPMRKMPITATPYRHQIEAFNFAMEVLTGGTKANG